MKKVKSIFKNFLCILPISLCVLICIYFLDLLNNLNEEVIFSTMYTDYTRELAITNVPSSYKLELVDELQLAIGILLIFTATVNWLMIVYLKHNKYMYKQKLKKRD